MVDAQSEAKAETRIESLVRGRLRSSGGHTIGAFRPVLAADRQSALIGVMRSADMLAAIAGGVIAYLLYDDASLAAVGHWTFIFLASVLLGNFLDLSHCYDIEAVQSLRSGLMKVVIGWASVTVGLISLADFFKVGNEFWQVSIGLWFWVTALMLVAIRFAVVILFRRWRRMGHLGCRLAVVGPGRFVDRLVDRLGRFDGVRIVSSVILPPDDPAPERANSEPAASGNMDGLLSMAQSDEVDEIIFASHSLVDREVQELLRPLHALAVDVKFYATGLETAALSPDRLDIRFGLPLYRIMEKPLDGWNRLLKRAEDVLIATATLPILLPVMAVIAVAIKLESPGPVLFCQSRSGLNNKIIRVYKFRSMYHAPEVEGAMVQARRNDARVTKIGRFLRRTSLDELPQIFNVLKGDMSLVGPRPHPTALDQKFIPQIDGYMSRLRVKPGITGWAQVNGLRGETDTVLKMQRRVEHDVFYIDNWSMAFDLKVLFMTLFVGFMNENAY